MRHRQRDRAASRTREDVRFPIVSLIAVTAFAVLLVRLGYLQVLQGGKYRELAEQQWTRTSDLLPQRGTIALEEPGSDTLFPLAATRRVLTAYAVPRDIRDLDGTVSRLVDILWKFEEREVVRRERLLAETGQLSRQEVEERDSTRTARTPEEQTRAEDIRREELTNGLRARLENRRDPYEPLTPSFQRFDASAIAELQQANLPGIEFREIADRYYPEETLAAHVLGIVREDGAEARGEYGIEGALNDILQGRAGSLKAERDVIGRWISIGGTNLRPAEDGADVVLTLNRVVQSIAEEVAKNGRDRFDAERATVIVMDPSTGDILALANYPTFNPNVYGDVRSVDVLRNASVSDLFEPGSVFKPLVMAAALDLGLVTPQTTMEDRGKLRIGGFTIDTYDGKHHGTITMTQVLEQSNNIGMVWVAQRVGAERLFTMLRRFGIGDRTGVPLEGEAAQSLPPPSGWKDTRVATVGFGQGVVMTPLQILAANAAIVNGGKLLEPHILKEVRFPDGRVEREATRVVRQAITPKISAQLTAMMTSIVENGVAKLAHVPGYYVGGKTGTAQVVDPATGRYATDKKIISFIGFAPAEKPRFIALVKLDNPAGLSLASGTAAPMFRDLATRLLKYYRVPPTRPVVSDPLRRNRAQ